MKMTIIKDKLGKLKEMEFKLKILEKFVIIGIACFILIIMFDFLISYDLGEKQFKSIACNEFNFNNLLNSYESMGGYILLNKGDESEYYNRTQRNYQEIYYYLQYQYERCAEI